MDLSLSAAGARVPRRAARLARRPTTRARARGRRRPASSSGATGSAQLNERGWAGADAGRASTAARGATLVEQAIFYEEIARAPAPRSMANVLGLTMGGPTVIAHGTEEQKERYLAPILSAEEIWCQGFSEPESGSDLASLKTRAVRDGDELASSPARRCGRRSRTTRSGACSSRAPTRTRPKHRGLTYFLMDMEQDGVEVRPLRQITGEAEFNELFIEEARIPDENVVGGEDNGWAVAITTLMHERAGARLRRCRSTVQIALRELVDAGPRARRGSADPWSATASRSCYIEAQVLRLNAYRGLTGDHEARRARARGLAGQVALGRGQPGADRAGDRPARARGAARRTTRGPTASCAPGPTRSRAGRPRSSRTSSPSACSGCRGRDELRPHRRPAGRSSAPRASSSPRATRSAEVRRLALEERARLHRRAVGGDRELGWPALRARGARRAGARHGRARGARRGARLRARADAAAVDVGGRARCSPPPARRAAGRRPARRRRAGARARRAAPTSACARTAADGVELAVPDAAAPTCSWCRRRAAACWSRRAPADGRAAPRRSTPRAGSATRALRRRAGEPLRRRRLRARLAGDRGGAAPPSRSASRSARWRWRSPTPRSASSSAARSAPTRPSRTRCAQMLLEVEGARAAVYYAAWALDHEPETAPARRLDGQGLRLGRRPRACPRPRSRSTAASASPGSTTCTSSSSAPGERRACSAPPRAAPRTASRRGLDPALTGARKLARHVRLRGASPRPRPTSPAPPSGSGRRRSA